MKKVAVFKLMSRISSGKNSTYVCMCVCVSFFFFFLMEAHSN